MNLIYNQAGMTREYSRIFLKVILVLENLSKVNFWTSKIISQYFKCIFWTSMSIFQSLTAYYWTSMSISGGPSAYYWTSMSILNSRNSLRGVGGRRAPAGRGRGDGGGGDSDGDVPTTLDIWRSPGPTCPGTKYPVRGIPHFDEFC